MASFPNFLIIGAPRSGTTLLYRNLARHPNVFMSPVKEPHYFTSHSGVSLEAYQALFADAKDEAAIGEASTLYLYCPESPAYIHERIPNVKLLAILRNPIERAYSHFLHHRRLGYETIADFGQALEAETKRKEAGLSPFLYYREVGLYGEQIVRYRDIFPDNQLLILLYEDLYATDLDAFSQILGFIGVERDFPFNLSVNYNPSGNPRYRWLHRFLNEDNVLKTGIKRAIPTKMQETLYLRALKFNLQATSMQPDVQSMLVEYYRSDIQKTSALIDRDLSHWLTT